MSNIISCEFMGGLGNQMFQASHAYAQGLKHNRPVVFRRYSSTKLQGRPINYYINTIFRNFTFIDEIKDFVKVDEESWEYSEINPSDKNTVFTGYFQSSKNFLGYDNIIKDLFSPDESHIDLIIKKYPQILYPNTLSIHVRRGDYLRFPGVHPTVGKSYIDKAISLVEGYTHLFVFSDDKSWVKNNFDYGSMTIVDEEDYMEIWIMSLCKNNIMSNSTFSWWGAFLNKSPNKIISPSVWFGDGGPKKYDDIYEKNMIKINVENISGELVYVA